MTIAPVRRSLVWLRAIVAGLLDKSKPGSHTGQVKDEPWSPPIVQVGDETVAYLLCWERHERDGSWHAWVTWIRDQAGRPRRHIVSVRAARVRPLELPGAYRQVPRRVRGSDGVIRPWVAPLHERVWIKVDLHGDLHELLVGHGDHRNPRHRQPRSNSHLRAVLRTRALRGQRPGQAGCARIATSAD